VLALGGYDEQQHLPLAVIDVEVALATEGPAAAVEVAAEALKRYDITAGSPRYAWPLVISAVMAASLAPGEEAAELLDRLRALAEKLDASGPVQRAWRLTYAALDPDAALNLEPACDQEAEPGTETESAAGTAADHGTGAAHSRLAAADAATAAWETVGQPYEAAIALTYAAKIALTERATREAMTRLRRAAPIAQRLGAAPLAAQITDLMRRAGSDTEAADPMLTNRELEVLRLVAAGQSNKEIAATLVISPKTASVHVSNILAKLRATTRTEAAVKAHELGLLGLLSR
jgi:DNA-binding CsgD family transcriptional regulator